jgi:hypothetical protein
LEGLGDVLEPAELLAVTGVEVVPGVPEDFTGADFLDQVFIAVFDEAVDDLGEGRRRKAPWLRDRCRGNATRRRAPRSWLPGHNGP